jgi:hypothetical protein
MTATNPVPKLGDWVCWRVFIGAPVHIGRVCEQPATGYVVLTTEGDRVFLLQGMLLAIVPSPVLGDS